MKKVAAKKYGMVHRVLAGALAMAAMLSVLGMSSTPAVAQPIDSAYAQSCLPQGSICNGTVTPCCGPYVCQNLGGGSMVWTCH